jgi:hypothetical protein
MSNKDDVTDDAEPEEWQYTQSAETAQTWLDDEIIPQLIEFDFENDDEDYVPGTATYGAFCNLAAILEEIGYTKEELINIIEQMFNDEITVPANTTLH